MSGPNLFIYMASCHSNRITTEIHNQMLGFLSLTLQWCHNGRDSVSSHQSHECLLKRLFRRRSRKTSKLRVTGLCVGNSSVTGEIPTQKHGKSFLLMTLSCWDHPPSIINGHAHTHTLTYGRWCHTQATVGFIICLCPRYLPLTQKSVMGELLYELERAYKYHDDFMIRDYFPVSGGHLHKEPVTRNFDVFFDVHLTKRLNKQAV